MEYLLRGSECLSKLSVAAVVTTFSSTNFTFFREPIPHVTTGGLLDDDDVGGDDGDDSDYGNGDDGDDDDNNDGGDDDNDFDNDNEDGDGAHPTGHHWWSA